MSLTVAALIASLLVTGLTSLASHQVTLIGGAAASLLFGFLGALNSNGRLHLVFLFGPLVLCALCLISTESNIAPGSSAIHILASYAALAGLAASSSDFSRFSRQLIVFTFLIQVTWVLVQTAWAGRLAAWTVSAAGSGGNLVAAQINMTLPLIVFAALKSQGAKRQLLWLAAMTGGLAVICVMSRNGIGTLLIMGTLIALFNRKTTALLTCSAISLVIVFLNELLQLGFVRAMLIRFRFLKFKADNSRTLIWEICSEHIHNAPWLGIGPGSSDRVLAMLGINHAHNNVIQVALESGIPAAIVAILLFGFLLHLPAVALLRDRSAFVLSMPIVAYFLISLTDNPIHHPQATLLLIACVNEARTANEIPGIPGLSAYSGAGLPPLRRVPTSVLQ